MRGRVIAFSIMNFGWLKKLFSFKKEGFQPAFIKNMASLQEVCVFPLPHVVLFPNTTIPLHIFEDRYKLMMDEVLRRQIPLAICWVGPQAGPSVVGLTCGAGKVNLLQAFPDGRKDVSVEGESRLQIVQILQQTPYIRALAKIIPDSPIDSPKEEIELKNELTTLVRRWIFLSGQLDDAYIRYVDLFPKPHYLADFIATTFLPSPEIKQRQLEITDRKRRVLNMIHFVKGQVEVLEEKNEPALKSWAHTEKVLH